MLEVRQESLSECQRLILCCSPYYELLIVAVQRAVLGDVQLTLRDVAQEDEDVAHRQGAEQREQRVSEDTAELPANSEHIFERKDVRHRGAR